MDAVIKIGQEAPQFQLSAITGESISLAELRGYIIVINFWSADCVWSERVDHQLMDTLDQWKENVKVLWIASNLNESVDLIERVSKERKLPAVLLDKHQKVANRYGAEVTPHFFVVDTKGFLAYQGAWDDITFRQRVATQPYVPKAVEAIMHDLMPQVCLTPPYGCTLVRYQD